MRTIVLTVFTLFISTLFYAQQGSMSISMEKFPVEDTSLDNESLLTGDGLSYDYFLVIDSPDLTSTYSYEVEIKTFDEVEIVKSFVISDIESDPELSWENSSVKVWMGTYEMLEILEYYITVRDENAGVIFSKEQPHVVE